MNHLKKFLAQLTLSLLFVLSSAAFIVFSKARITYYLSQIQAYASQVISLNSIAATPEGIAQLQGILEAINPIVMKASIYTYAIVPLVLLILWAAFIGSSFYLSLKDTKVNCKKYILKFLLLSIIPTTASEYMALKMLEASSDFFLAGAGLWSLIILFSGIIIVNYFAFTAYALAATVELKQIMQKTVMLSIKKIHLILPMFLLLSAAVIALLVATMSTYLNLASNNLGLSIAYNIIALMVALSAAILVKNKTIKIIIKRFRAL